MFYTYAHTKPDGTIFYIGKGKDNRAWDKYNRSTYWKRFVNKHGFNVEILANWKTEEEAFSHEILLISCFNDMKVNLVNHTDGGEGVSGLKHSEVAKLKIGKASSERKRSESTKTKSSKSQPKCKACVVNDIVYHSVGFAAKQLGISQAMLSMWLNNKRKPGTKINIKNYGWV